MGSGKTKLGKRLARLLHYNFIDLDKQIEEKENTSIAGLFENKGEEYFREKESEYLRQLQDEKTVVATGGGTPCYYDNMNWMLQHGKCVWLKVSEEELFRRLREKRDKRPLLRNLSDDELKNFISSKLSERSRYYSMAHLIIPSDGLKEKKLAGQLLSH